MATLKVTNIKNESFAGDQLYLKTDGTIGIGTTSPGHKLVISQTNSGGIAAIHLPVDESTILGPNANTYLKMGGNVVLGANGQIDFSTSGASKITLKNDGKVGIGTTSPTELLDVEGTIECLNELRSKTGNDLKLNAGSANRDVFLQVNDSTLMTVQGSTGNVGIGTTAPTNLLQIHASAPVFAIRDTASYSAYANGGKIYFQGTDSDGAVKTFAGVLGVSQSSNNGQLRLQTRTGGTLYDRLTIVASGRTGIWTTDPKGTLDIQTCGSDGVPTIAFGGNNSASTGTTRTDGTDKAVRVGCVHQTNAEQPFAIFYAVAGASNHNTINYGGGTSWMNAATRHQFHTAANTTTTAGTNKMTIHQGGDVEIIDGNLKVASTHGIDFSATADSTGSNISMDSELLDDYERGTWGSINTGADSCTFSHNWYIKIGRVVTCNVRLSGITNGNGSALTLNLPFANGTVEASGSVACDTFNMPSDWVLMNSYAYDAKLYILASRDNAGWENLLGNMTANNSTIIMNITYLANS